MACRNTKELVTGESNGEPAELYKHCKRVRCPSCKVIFKIRKRTKRKYCIKCTEEREKRKKPEGRKLEPLYHYRNVYRNTPMYVANQIKVLMENGQW
jgi:hypothetical protein